MKEDFCLHPFGGPTREIDDYISYLVSRISYLVSRISYLVSRISYLVSRIFRHSNAHGIGHTQ